MRHGAGGYALSYVTRRARGRHRRLGLGRAVRAHTRALAEGTRPFDHLGRSQSRSRNSLLSHGEALQLGATSPARFHRGVLSLQAQERVGRLDAGGGVVRLTMRGLRTSKSVHSLGAGDELFWSEIECRSRLSNTMTAS